MMGKFSKSIAVVWPARWMDESIPMPDEMHVTVIYLGEMPVRFSHETVLEAMRAPVQYNFLAARTTEVEMFGPNADIPVIRVESNVLHNYRHGLEHYLNKAGIFNASKYKEYKPHITLDSPDAPVDSRAILSSPELWWGDERYKIN